MMMLGSILLLSDRIVNGNILAELIVLHGMDLVNVSCKFFFKKKKKKFVFSSFFFLPTFLPFPPPPLFLSFLFSLRIAGR